MGPSKIIGGGYRKESSVDDDPGARFGCKSSGSFLSFLFFSFAPSPKGQQPRER